MGSDEEEKASSNNFATTDLGRRLLAAEQALQMIHDGKLPNIKRLVSKAVFNTRTVSDFSAFEAQENQNVDRSSLNAASEPSAYLMMNLTGVPQATLFYPRGASVNDTQLFSSYFPRLIGMMYTAVGLDVDHAAEVNQDTLDKLLRKGIVNK